MELRRPDWALPPGVPRGAWDYAATPSIATEYDAFHAGNYLLELDLPFVAQHATGETAVDLGCGSGRAVEKLLELGFEVLAVDLSPHMLRVTQNRAARFATRVTAALANLVDLSAVASQRFDVAVCLFNTLGMIEGRNRRLQVLREVRRILRPGGTLILHVHNVWAQLYTSAGRSWLWQLLWTRGAEWGDKTFPYRGLPNMYLHLFRPGLLRKDLRQAGFRIGSVQRLDAVRQSTLRLPGFLPDFRADGMLMACQA